MEPVPVNEGTAETIVEHHFGKRADKVTKRTEGQANFVYEVKLGADDYIIRISDFPAKLQTFLKEQWAVAQARERGVPAPEILEVGNEAIPNPYMIIRKSPGTPALHHPDRMRIIKDLGKFASMINTIPTSGFGYVFDWSHNTLSRKETWKEYLEKELNVPERIAIFEKNEMLTKENLDRLKGAFREIEGWDKSPTLNHSDMRIKNMLVDEEGKITAVLDWENAISCIAPYWELAIALHDLNVDERQAFLEGYGIREKDFKDMARGVKALNIILYAIPHITAAIERKDKKFIDKMKLRLNGHLDLFSL